MNPIVVMLQQTLRNIDLDAFGFDESKEHWSNFASSESGGSFYEAGTFGGRGSDGLVHGLNAGICGGH
jgi:hypothetical protein